MFERLDLYILDHIFQPACDWWHNLTGKNNFWVARACIVVIFACRTLECALLLVRGTPMSFVLPLLVFNTVALVLIFTPALHIFEQRVLQNKKTLNPARIFVPMGIFRMAISIFEVSLFLGGTIELATNAYLLGRKLPVLYILSTVQEMCANIAWVTCLYFIACTMKPRKPREVRVPTHALPQGT